MTLPQDLLARPLKAGDMQALTELARVCDETYVDWVPRGWMVPVAPRGWADRYLADDAWGLVVHNTSGMLVGTAAFRAESPELAHVGLVFVHPTRWRQGIAATLMQLAEQEMRARGFIREQLWTPDGAPAERFYTAQGWARDGRREWHPWVALDMVGYAKDLL